MDLRPEIENYIKETINDCLGLPLSSGTHEAKLGVAQETERHFRSQHLLLVHELKEKDEVIGRTRAEAMMNARALKKFVEENQKLAVECTNLLNQSKKWEKECLLYNREREALLDFGAEADRRAKEAAGRVQELEKETGKLLEELQYYKHEHDARLGNMPIEENLLDSVLATVVGEDVISAHSFLEANSRDESCSELLRMRNNLKPSTLKALSLVAKVKVLEKDEEHLRIELNKTEEEVKLQLEDSKMSDKGKKRPLGHQHWGVCTLVSDGIHSISEPAMPCKRICVPKDQ